MKRLSTLTLSLISGLLLWASWPVSPLTFLIFIAFVPLLLAEQKSANGKRFFYAVWLTMLVWNVGATWWICNATLPGGIAALIVSSLLMCIPWMLFYFIKRKAGEAAGYLSFIALWLSFEYLQLQNWGLSWPWLTLGNIFASHPGWVQWYEYTGTSGGSLWVLVINVLVFKSITTPKRKIRVFNRMRSTVEFHLAAIILWLLLPLVGSIKIDRSIVLQQEDSRRDNIVIIQPNIDPYSKFDAATQDQQLQKLLQLSNTGIDSNTSLLIWPETALAGTQGFDESRLTTYAELIPLWVFLQQHPQLTLYTGVESYRFYTEDNKTSTASYNRNANIYYDAYNSAALLNKEGMITRYHKSRLVPGVETLPPFLKFIDNWFEEFGGTTSGYVGQSARTILSDEKSGYKIAPAICYESVYGEFLTAYIRNGANVIGIITNDGWWGNTAGYQQHMQYARLRAIETRRWVVRSANTGISCFINPAGKVMQPQPWNTAAAIKMNVPAETRLTFFVQHGDIISKVALGMGGLLLLWSLILSFRKRN